MQTTPSPISWGTTGRPATPIGRLLTPTWRVPRRRVGQTVWWMLDERTPDQPSEAPVHAAPDTPGPEEQAPPASASEAPAAPPQDGAPPEAAAPQASATT